MRERRIGLEPSGRRRDAGDQRRPVGDEDEDEQRADKGAIGPRLGLHRVADLAIDGLDDQLEQRLQRRSGVGFSARVTQDGADDQHGHDRPGRHHRLADRRPGRCGTGSTLASGEIMPATALTRRITSNARDARSRARSPAAAARRLDRRPARAPRAISAKRPATSATASGIRPPVGEQLRAPPERTRNRQPPTPSAERQPADQASDGDEGDRAHALLIQRQADQQPSAVPSISSGAVQKMPL